MSSPFAIEGPAVISFSGGRTSGYMLRRCLDEGLRPDVHVLFADTGKERSETYDFVLACAAQWGVIIHRVERAHPVGTPAFEQLITDRKFLPNPVIRFCTQELKIRPMKAWMMGRGYKHWTNVVGIRADEPRRMAKMRAADSSKERWDIALPLAEAGVSGAEVNAFWSAQSFDLQLQPWEGNCDLCFLKGRAKRVRIMEDRPDLAAWWVEQERRIAGRFRAHSQSYAALLESARRQRRMFSVDQNDDLGDCICHEGTQDPA